MSHSNRSHDYGAFATAYAQLELTDTYYLAYRDLPGLFRKHVKGARALDHGCGAGRSTRFLKRCGFDAVGVDPSSDMVAQALSKDPGGTYFKIDGLKLPFRDKEFPFVFQSIVLMEVGSRNEIVRMLREIHRVLNDDGILILITDSPESYSNDSASFVRSFPENRNLTSGRQAVTVVRGSNIRFMDYLWTVEDCLGFFREAGFSVEEQLRPLATGDEPFKWYSETKDPWWDIYVLHKRGP